MHGKDYLDIISKIGCKSGHSSLCVTDEKTSSTTKPTPYSTTRISPKPFPTTKASESEVAGSKILWIGIECYKVILLMKDFEFFDEFEYMALWTRVGISGYGFWNKIHLLDSDSFYLLAGYYWIWISFCHIITDNFGLRYKNFKNRIQRVPEWIQVSKIVSI